MTAPAANHGRIEGHPVKKPKPAPPSVPHGYTDGQIVKVWITKYALTTGLFELQVHIHLNRDRPDAKPYAKCGIALFTQQWTATYEEAKAVAEVMRKAHLASLRRQVAKLEQATFKPVAAPKAYQKAWR